MNKALERPASVKTTYKLHTKKVRVFSVEFVFWGNAAEYGEIDTQKETVCFKDRQLVYDFLNYLDKHPEVIGGSRMEETEVSSDTKIYKKLPRVEDFDRS